MNFLQLTYSQDIHPLIKWKKNSIALREIAKLESLNCIYFSKLISFSDINCKECGSHFSPCIASGQSILAKEYYTCKTCKHKALESELNYLKLKHCPLCHGKISLGGPGDLN